jgi:Protein of unknown function (DUF5818)
MKKHSILLKSLAGSAVLGGLLLSGPRLVAQDANSQPPAGQAAQAGQDQQAQTFMGRIAKSGGTLVLKGGYANQDPNAKTTYKLDDQEKAKQYVGKNVKVTGTLDTSSNTIHVSAIEKGSS